MIFYRSFQEKIYELKMVFKKVYISTDYISILSQNLFGIKQFVKKTEEILGVRGYI